MPHYQCSSHHSHHPTRSSTLGQCRLCHSSLTRISHSSSLKKVAGFLRSMLCTLQTWNLFGGSADVFPGGSDAGFFPHWGFLLSIQPAGIRHSCLMKKVAGFLRSTFLHAANMEPVPTRFVGPCGCNSCECCEGWGQPGF